MEVLNSPEFSFYVQRLIDHHVTGLAIAVVQERKIASRGFGKASLNPPRDFTPDTLICVGSAAKSLTAAAVACLVDDDEKYPEVQYNATMQSLLPDDFVVPGEDHANITVEDVLSHRTGMPPHELSLFGPNAECPDSAYSITRNIRNLPTVAPNRSKFIYCNRMYTVASYLVECKSGNTFSDFLQQNILGPLRMDSTCLFAERVAAKGLSSSVATRYRWDKKVKEYKELQHVDAPESQGAGQIFTSVNDYAKWIKAILHREGPITQGVFTGFTRKRIRQESSMTEPNDDELAIFYATGWDVRSYNGITLFSHDGGEVGYQCTHFFIPEVNFGGAIFSNTDHAGAIVSQLTFRLIDVVLQTSQSLSSKEISVPDLEYHLDFESEESDSDDVLHMELRQELEQKLCPGLEEPQAQVLPLSVYTGQYWNPGYKMIQIEEKDGSLVIDASDRSLGFTLTFQHICEQKKFIGCIDFGNGDIETFVKAEFVFHHEVPAKVGLQLEESLDDYIWFDRSITR